MKRYSLDELHIGMRVTLEQLENIYGTWVHLADYNKSSGGEIIYLTSDENDCKAYEYTKDYVGRMSIFYQNHDYAKDNVIAYG